MSAVTATAVLSPPASRPGSPEFKPDCIGLTELEPLLESPESLLLIDARPQSDYLVSHIKNALSVRLSSLMTRRLSKGTNQLYDLVIQEQKAQYVPIRPPPALVRLHRLFKPCASSPHN